MLRTLIRLVRDTLCPEAQGNQPANVSPASATPPPDYAARLEAYEALQRSLQLELAKVIWTSSMDFIKTTTQLLQALTTLLVTAYIAFIAALGKQLALNTIPTVWVVLPIILFLASLAASFATAARYQGEPLQLTDLAAAADAFERTVQHRRKQLWAPSILLLLGIAALAYFAYLLPLAPERLSSP
jgi:hypothetical protein